MLYKDLYIDPSVMTYMIQAIAGIGLLHVAADLGKELQ